MAARDRVLGIDPLGRVNAPSLLIAHRFRGDRWILDAKVTYHGFEQTASGRNVDISVIFGKANELAAHRVLISRRNDNPGDPADRGSLELIFTPPNGHTFSIPLNSLDTYFLRIERVGRDVIVWVSAEGYRFIRIGDTQFDANIDETEQAVAINGIAFDPGAAAEIHYITIRALPGAKAQPIDKPSVFAERGEPKHPISVHATDIAAALLAGQVVDVENAVVDGNLYLSAARQKPIVGRFTCKSCVFSGRIIAPWQTFSDDVSLVGCIMKGEVSFWGSSFRAKADFDGSRFRNTVVFISATFGGQGADFSGVRFEDPATRAWFRGAEFQGPASFYGAVFNGGADFSRTYRGRVGFVPAEFKDDVTFSDVTVGQDKDLLFYKAAFHKRVLFYVAPHRVHSSVAYDPMAPLFPRQALGPSNTLGRELSFEAAEFSAENSGDEYIPGLPRKPGLSGLILSADPPTNPEERFGSSTSTFGTRLTLRDASVGQLTLGNLTFTGTVDLRGAIFSGTQDSVRLLDVEFERVLIDEWPSTKVVATRRTRDALVRIFDSAGDASLARIIYFDLLAASTYYDRWVSKRPHYSSYRDYGQFRISEVSLNIFRVLSSYGTSIPRILLTGGIVVLSLTVLLLAMDSDGCLVRTDRPPKFGLRLADVPILGPHEHVLENHNGTEQATDRLHRSSLDRIAGIVRRVERAFLFSLDNVTKFGGFGSIRLRPAPRTPRILIAASWATWLVGYLWIAAIVYALTAIPVLKGLIR
jgi:hypothetical protein